MAVAEWALESDVIVNMVGGDDVFFFNVASLQAPQELRELMLTNTNLPAFKILTLMFACCRFQVSNST